MRILASAPTRIDLAGGTIDIWPLFLFHPGAQTLNVAISLRAHASIEPLDGEGIEIVSKDTDRHVVASSAAELATDTTLPLLGRLISTFGGSNFKLTTRAESPAGAGIAGSSAMAVAVSGALARWTERSIEPESLLEIALNVEAQTIAAPTGVQDYRPAMYGGANALELGVDGVRRVPLSIDPQELERRIVLCYTGAPRNSGTNNWEIIKRHIDGDRQVFDCFERIRDTAADMRQALVRDDWSGVGAALAREWDNRKRLAPGVTTPVIDDLMARAKAAGADAAKVCGAGGGGCLFCLAPPARLAAVREALAAGGARILDFRVETTGLRLDISEGRFHED